MDWKPGREMYIGLALGFVFILLAGLIIGVPLRDLAIWTVIFAVAAVIFVQVLKRIQRHR